MRNYVHQHVWTGPLLAGLAARECPPLVRGSNGLTVLHTQAEQPYVIDPSTESADQHAARMRRDLEVALISLWNPIGIEGW